MAVFGLLLRPFQTTLQSCVFQVLISARGNQTRLPTQRSYCVFTSVYFPGASSFSVPVSPSFFDQPRRNPSTDNANQLTHPSFVLSFPLHLHFLHFLRCGGGIGPPLPSLSSCGVPQRSKSKVPSAENPKVLCFNSGVGENYAALHASPGCGARSTALWVHRNRFWQLSRDGNLHGSDVSTPRQLLQNHPSGHLGR